MNKRQSPTTGNHIDATKHDEFDFDHWMQLAASDPEQFARQRQAAIDEVIEQAPDTVKRRLKGLQFQIDMERERHKNSLASTIRLTEMMWEMVLKEGGFLDSLEVLLGNKDTAVLNKPTDRKANVIHFGKKQ